MPPATTSCAALRLRRPRWRLRPRCLVAQLMLDGSWQAWRQPAGRAKPATPPACLHLAAVLLLGSI